jgi:hypothetical protein
MECRIEESRRDLLQTNSECKVVFITFGHIESSSHACVVIE